MERLGLCSSAVANRQIAAKLNELERKTAAHDKNIVALFHAVRGLMAVPEKPKGSRLRIL